MASAGAIGNERFPPEQEITLQSYFRLHVGSDEGQGFVASFLHLHRLRVRIEFAHEAVSVLFRGCRYVGNKGLDEVPAGSAQRFRAAKVCGVCLDKSRIEVVLADQKAQFVPQPGMTIV